MILYKSQDFFSMDIFLKIDKYTDKRFIIGFIFEIIIVGQVITLSKKIKAKIKLLGI